MAAVSVFQSFFVVRSTWAKFCLLAGKTKLNTQNKE